MTCREARKIVIDRFPNARIKKYAFYDNPDGTPNFDKFIVRARNYNIGDFGDSITDAWINGAKQILAHPELI